MKTKDKLVATIIMPAIIGPIPAPMPNAVLNNPITEPMPSFLPSWAAIAVFAGIETAEPKPINKLNRSRM